MYVGIYIQISGFVGSYFSFFTFVNKIFSFSLLSYNVWMPVSALSPYLANGFPLDLNALAGKENEHG